MSTNLINKTTGELVTLANGTRMWIGTKSAHDLAVQQDTMPNNCMVCITDDAAGEEAWQYSTDETRTGKTWIDGKPIYRKVVDVGTIPSGSSKHVAHGIQNLDRFLELKIIAKGSTNNFEFVFGGDKVAIYANSVNLELSAGNYPDYTGYAILEYTKTTD